MSLTFAPAFVRLFSINCATAALSADVFQDTRRLGQHVRFQEGRFDAVQRLRVQASDIVRILGVDDTEQGGHILDVAANRTSGIIVLDQRNHTAAIHDTFAGIHADHAIPTGRNNQRPCRLGADADHRFIGSRAGALPELEPPAEKSPCGFMVSPPTALAPGGKHGDAAGKFRQIGLAQNHGAGLAELLDE